jgi:hypothetical protein
VGGSESPTHNIHLLYLGFECRMRGWFNADCRSAGWVEWELKSAFELGKESAYPVKTLADVRPNVSKTIWIFSHRGDALSVMISTALAEGIISGNGYVLAGTSRRAQTGTTVHLRRLLTGAA